MLGVAKMRLIKEARKKHGKIFALKSKILLSRCFTIEDNELILWYNTADHSTHIIKMVLKRNINN